MLQNTYGDLSPRVGVKSAARLLKTGQALMHTQRFAYKDTQTKNSGQTRKWRRYRSFPSATAPLQEGVTPASQKLLYDDYTATLQQFGAVSDLTDVIADTHEDPILQEQMDKSGEQMAQTVEVITLNVLKGGTQVFYAGSASTRATMAGVPTRGDFRKIKRSLRRARASKITNIIAPTASVSTAGIEPGYIALAHVDCEADLRNMVGWKSTVEYANPGQAMPGEEGSCESFRFLLTDLLDPWMSAGASSATYIAGGGDPSGSVACDVYPILCFGRDAYGAVRLQGREAVHVMVLNPGVARGGDELGQRGSVGWKIWYACAILNEAWIARLECAATANPT